MPAARTVPRVAALGVRNWRPQAQGGDSRDPCCGSPSQGPICPSGRNLFLRAGGEVAKA